MKPFSLLKIAVLLPVLGALLLFTPACKAQSEVNPDHFDGTDPWEIAARKPVTSKTKPGPAPASYQAQNKKAGAVASLQLAAVRDLSNSARHHAATVQDNRKKGVRQSDKK